MVVCPRCGTSNQEHYMYCLGCGAMLGDGAGVSGPPGSAKPPRPPTSRPTGAPPWAGSTAQGASPSQPTSRPAAGASWSPPPPGAVPSDAAGTGGPSAHLLLIRPDGSEGEAFEVRDGAVVGRDAGALFVGDAYLSPRHALFRVDGDAYWVEDLGSLNGVYFRLSVDVPYILRSGSVFRIGQEIIRFEPLPLPPVSSGAVEMMGSPNPGFLGRICLVTGRDSIGNAYCIPSDGLYLGRERGDIIFPDDGYVSGLHCRIHGEAGEVSVTDVGSSNGTFVRASREHRLKSGTMLLLGQQLFRLEMG